MDVGVAKVKTKEGTIAGDDSAEEEEVNDDGTMCQPLSCRSLKRWMLSLLALSEEEKVSGVSGAGEGLSIAIRVLM